jgi:hypothetical protein
MNTSEYSLSVIAIIFYDGDIEKRFYAFIRKSKEEMEE